MQRQFTSSVLLIGVVCAPAGCASMKPVQNFADKTAEAFTPTTSGYRDTTREKPDDFAAVGEMARDMRPPEKDPDPWFRKYLMSQKARSIEHNLGIE